MDRRSFIKGILIGAGLIAAQDALNITESILKTTESLTDEQFEKFDFVAYYTITMNLYCHNPRQLGYIT